MLRAVIPWGPESAGFVNAVGTTAAGAPTIQARFTFISTGVGQTAFVLPGALAGMWFVVSTDGVATGRMFTQSGEGLYVGGAAYDNTTPYQILADKAVLVACTLDGIWHGVALG